MSETDIKNIELSIKEAEALVALGQAVERLKSNPDFAEVVTKGFLKNEAIRLVHLKSDPSMQSKQHQKIIDRDIHAIGSFTSFIATVSQRARMAKEAIGEDEAELELLRQEDLQGASEAAGSH